MRFRKKQTFKPGDTPEQMAAKLNRTMRDIERGQGVAGTTTVVVSSGGSSSGSGGGSGSGNLMVRTSDGLSLVSNVNDLALKETDGFTVAAGGVGIAQVGLEQPIKKASTPEFAGEKLTAPLELVAAAAPASPAADHVKVYVKASGVSPNREVAYCMKDEAGQEIIISSVLV
jgi:hypothetical protein